MSKFIEVTNKRTGERVLINSNLIELVECVEGSSTIYLGFIDCGAISQDYVECKESYEEIKKMLEC